MYFTCTVLRTEYFPPYPPSVPASLPFLELPPSVGFKLYIIIPVFLCHGLLLLLLSSNTQIKVPKHLKLLDKDCKDFAKI